MNILGLDLGTKKTGWSIFKDDKLVDYGVISCDHKNVRVRTLTIRDEIKKLIESNDINRAVVEELKVGFGGGMSNFNTVVTLAVLQGCVLGLCIDYDVEFIPYDPSVWRKLTEVNRKRIECKTCGWLDEFIAGEDITECPKCGEKRKSYLKTYLLNKRLDLKQTAVDIVNRKYGLKLVFYPRDTKKNISNDDIAEAILIAQAHIYECNL